MDNEKSLLLAAGHEVEQHLETNSARSAAAALELAASPWNPAAVNRVLRKVDSFRPDVVHVHNTWFSLSQAVFPAIRQQGVPVVATIHNYRLSCLNAMLYRKGSPCEDCVGHIPWRGVVRGCYRGSVVQSGVMATGLTIHRFLRTWEKDVDAIIALTQFAARQLLAAGIPAERIKVKGNTVPDPGARKISVGSSPTVLFIGRLTEEKGVIDLLDAWQIARPRNLELLVVGDGPLAGRLQPPPGVTMMGEVPSHKIAELMSRGRAAVVASRWYEGQPMVVLESLASGLPVVVPNLGALPEIAGAGGVAFAPADVGALARAIEGLAEDDRVAAVGAAARNEYESKFSSAVGLERLEAIYESVLQARRP